jgi:hypothetical protein
LENLGYEMSETAKISAYLGGLNQKIFEEIIERAESVIDSCSIPKTFEGITRLTARIYTNYGNKSMVNATFTYTTESALVWSEMRT